MKKRIALIMAASLLAFSLAACSSSNTTEETEDLSLSEEDTEDKAEEEEEEKEEEEKKKEDEEKKKEDEDSTMTVEGEVTDSDGSTMTVKDSESGKSYDYKIATAKMDLNSDGLYDGITVRVVSNTEEDEDGLYEATEVTEISENKKSDSGSGSGKGKGSGSGSSTLSVEGEVTYADGSTITVKDSESGESYDFMILDAKTSFDKKGLSEGIKVKVTADSKKSSDGYYEATEVTEVE